MNDKKAIEKLNATIKKLNKEKDEQESTLNAIKTLIKTLQAEKKGLELGVEVGCVCKYAGQEVRISRIDEIGVYYNKKTKSGKWSKNDFYAHACLLHK